MRKPASGRDRAMTPVEARQRAVEVARLPPVVVSIARATGGSDGLAMNRGTAT